MQMKLRLLFVYPVLCAYPIGFACALAQEPEFLVKSHVPKLPWLGRLDFSGKSAEGNFRILVNRSKKNSRIISVAAYLGNHSTDIVNLTPLRFPELDLHTVTLEQYRVEEVRISFQFGERRAKCFLNNDGRNRVSVVFSTTNHPILYITSFENCSTTTETVRP